MRDEAIRNVGIWVAGAGGIVALASLVSPLFQPALYPSLLLVAGAAGLLFLRMVFSRFYQEGIALANIELRGDPRLPRRRIKLLDPEWGLFGARTGTTSLQRVRAALFVGAMPLLLTQNWVDTAVIELWWASMFTAMILSMMHAAIVTDQQRR